MKTKDEWVNSFVEYFFKEASEDLILAQENEDLFYVSIYLSEFNDGVFHLYWRNNNKPITNIECMKKLILLSKGGIINTTCNIIEENLSLLDIYKENNFSPSCSIFSDKIVNYIIDNKIESLYDNCLQYFKENPVKLESAIEKGFVSDAHYFINDVDVFNAYLKKGKLSSIIKHNDFFINYENFSNLALILLENGILPIIDKFDNQNEQQLKLLVNIYNSDETMSINKYLPTKNLNDYFKKFPFLIDTYVRMRTLLFGDFDVDYFIELGYPNIINFVDMNRITDEQIKKAIKKGYNAYSYLRNEKICSAIDSDELLETFIANNNILIPNDRVSDLDFMEKLLDKLKPGGVILADFTYIKNSSNYELKKKVIDIDPEYVIDIINDCYEETDLLIYAIEKGLSVFSKNIYDFFKLNPIHNGFNYFNIVIERTSELSQELDRELIDNTDYLKILVDKYKNNRSDYILKDYQILPHIFKYEYKDILIDYLKVMSLENYKPNNYKWVKRFINNNLDDVKDIIIGNPNLLNIVSKEYIDNNSYIVKLAIENGYNAYRYSNKTIVSKIEEFISEDITFYSKYYNNVFDYLLPKKYYDNKLIFSNVIAQITEYSIPEVACLDFINKINEDYDVYLSIFKINHRIIKYASEETLVNHPELLVTVFSSYYFIDDILSDNIIEYILNNDNMLDLVIKRENYLIDMIPDKYLSNEYYLFKLIEVSLKYNYKINDNTPKIILTNYRWLSKILETNDQVELIVNNLNKVYYDFDEKCENLLTLYIDNKLKLPHKILEKHPEYLKVYELSNKINDIGYSYIREIALLNDDILLNTCSNIDNYKYIISNPRYLKKLLENNLCPSSIIEYIKHNDELLDSLIKLGFIQILNSYTMSEVAHNPKVLMYSLKYPNYLNNTIIDELNEEQLTNEVIEVCLKKALIPNDTEKLKRGINKTIQLPLASQLCISSINFYTKEEIEKLGYNYEDMLYNYPPITYLSSNHLNIDMLSGLIYRGINVSFESFDDNTIEQLLSNEALLRKIMRFYDLGISFDKRIFSDPRFYELSIEKYHKFFFLDRLDTETVEHIIDKYPEFISNYLNDNTETSLSLLSESIAKKINTIKRVSTLNYQTFNELIEYIQDEDVMTLFNFSDKAIIAIKSGYSFDDKIPQEFISKLNVYKICAKLNTNSNNDPEIINLLEQLTDNDFEYLLEILSKSNQIYFLHFYYPNVSEKVQDKFDEYYLMLHKKERIRDVRNFTDGELRALYKTQKEKLYKQVLNNPYREIVNQCVKALNYDSQFAYELVQNELFTALDMLDDEYLSLLGKDFLLYSISMHYKITNNSPSVFYDYDILRKYVLLGHGEFLSTLLSGANRQKVINDENLIYNAIKKGYMPNEECEEILNNVKYVRFCVKQNKFDIIDKINSDNYSIICEENLLSKENFQKIFSNYSKKGYNPSKEICNYIDFILYKSFVIQEYIHEKEDIYEYFNETGLTNKTYLLALLSSKLFDYVFTDDYEKYYQAEPEIKQYINFTKKYGFIFIGLYISKYEDIKNVFDAKGISEEFKKSLTNNKNTAEVLLNNLSHNDRVLNNLSMDLVNIFKYYIIDKYFSSLSSEKQNEMYDYLFKKIGPELLFNLNNEKINKLIYIEPKELDKIFKVFNASKYDIVPNNIAYDNIVVSIINYEFAKKYPNIVDIFTVFSTILINMTNEEFNQFINGTYSGELSNNLIDITSDLVKYLDLDDEEVNDFLSALIERRNSNDEKLRKYCRRYLKKKEKEYLELNGKDKLSDIGIPKLFDRNDSVNKLYNYLQENISYKEFDMYRRKFIKNLDYESFNSKSFIEILNMNKTEYDIILSITEEEYNLIVFSIRNKTKPDDLVKKKFALFKRFLKVNANYKFENENVTELLYSLDAKLESLIVLKDIDVINVLKEMDVELFLDTIGKDSRLLDNITGVFERFFLGRLPDQFTSYFESLGFRIPGGINNVGQFITKYYNFLKQKERLLANAGTKVENLGDINFFFVELIQKISKANAETFEIKRLVGGKEYDDFAADPMNNSSRINRSDRENKLVLLLDFLYTLDKVTIPSKDEILTINNKSINIIVGNRTNSSNICHGERTGACMRVGGVGEGLFLKCLTDKNWFHIRFEDPVTHEYISRVSGFRNGNTVYLNQLRYSSDKNKYTDEDLQNFIKAYAENLIEETKDSEYPIENVFINTNYAMSSYTSTIYYLGNDIKKEYNLDGLDMYRLKRYDDTIWTDVSGKAYLLATTEEGKKTKEGYVELKNGPEDTLVYEAVRDKIYGINHEDNDIPKHRFVKIDSNELIEKINRVNGMKQKLLGANYKYDISDEVEQDIIDGYASSDWYVYIDTSFNIHYDFIKEIKTEFELIPYTNSTQAEEEMLIYKDILMSKYNIRKMSL